MSAKEAKTRNAKDIGKRLKEMKKRLSEDMDRMRESKEKAAKLGESEKKLRKFVKKGQKIMLNRADIRREYVKATDNVLDKLFDLRKFGGATGSEVSKKVTSIIESREGEITLKMLKDMSDYNKKLEEEIKKARNKKVAERLERREKGIKTEEEIKEETRNFVKNIDKIFTNIEELIDDATYYKKYSGPIIRSLEAMRKGAGARILSEEEIREVNNILRESEIDLKELKKKKERI